jgi:hypothetical protein
MRFAWIKKNSADYVDGEQSATYRLMRMAYNAAWWVPLVLVLTKAIDYRTGFIAFGILTVIRLAANLYLNNGLDPEQAESFPFRA